MFNIGGSELFFIVFIVLMLFGSKKLPEIARGLGKGIREMKDAASGIEREITKEMKDVKDDIDIKKMIGKE
ncbi:MAG: twin-arginine translocase TatA/TatE family subunit [Bacteroidetes bacterium]|nr:twin-arginine translocase TatA/TatE family subunit [Bacteroidota bacterium]